MFLNMFLTQLHIWQPPPVCPRWKTVHFFGYIQSHPIPDTKLNLDLSPSCYDILPHITLWFQTSIFSPCDHLCSIRLWEELQGRRETPGLSSLGNPGESGLEKGADCLSDSFGGNPKTRLLPTLSANKCTHIKRCTENQTPMLNPHTAP